MLLVLNFCSRRFKNLGLCYAPVDSRHRRLLSCLYMSFLSIHSCLCVYKFCLFLLHFIAFPVCKNDLHPMSVWTANFYLFIYDFLKNIRLNIFFAKAVVSNKPPFSNNGRSGLTFSYELRWRQFIRKL
jgi:hypothetical protein